MVPRALFALTVLGVLGKADDDVTRSKRFFNLHSYFKSTSDSSANGATTAPTRNVKILGSGSSCVGDSNCSLVTVAKFEATPASYLTPPSAWPERNGGSYYPPTADQYQTNQNGYYEYPAPVARNATPFPTGYEEGEHRSGYYYGPTARALPTDTQPLNVKLKNVMCIKSAKNGRFTVGMTTSKSLPATPVIENGYTTDNLPQCSVTTLDSTTFQLHIQEPDMISCGVYYCDSDIETNLMCVTIRFPLIPGIKTRDDALMKIECRPQQQLVSQTRQFNLKPSQINARSLPLHATITGGNPNPELRVQMGLYAMTKTGFTQPLSNNDVIAVGDDLQLRAVVRQGDGWYYSRFGQVLVQRVASPGNGYAYGENPDSVVVVAEDGCVSQQMKSGFSNPLTPVKEVPFSSDEFNNLLQPICPFGPFNDPGNPLISILNLQVFIFNDMRDGDELTMLVTVFGCIHYEDCFPKNNLCQEWTAPRYRRSISTPTNVTDSTSEIKLKILKSSKTRRLIQCNQNVCHEIKATGFKNPVIVISFTVVCVIGIAVFLTLYYSNSKRLIPSVRRLYTL